VQTVKLPRPETESLRFGDISVHGPGRMDNSWPERPGAASAHFPIGVARSATEPIPPRRKW
jgi:hypothetical protein